MLFSYIRLFKSLPRLQHLVIFLTTFAAPISFELVQGLIATGLCLSCVNAGRLALYFVWYQIAMLVIAASTRADRTRVEVSLTQIYSELDEGIRQLGEENKREITSIQDRVGDIDNTLSDLRYALEEELGVKLPGRRHSVRAGSISHHWSLPIPEVTVGRSPYRMARLRSWVKRQALRFWILTRKLVWDWDDDQAN